MKDRRREIGELCRVARAIMEYAERRGETPISQDGKAYVRRIDDVWTVAANGTTRRQIVGPIDCAGPVIIPALEFRVWFRGLLAGAFLPEGGAFAVGLKANEKNFVAAIRAALEGEGVGR